MSVLIRAEDLAEALVMSDARIRVAHGDGWRVPEEYIFRFHRSVVTKGKTYERHCEEFCAEIVFHPALNNLDKMRIFGFVWEGGWTPEEWLEEEREEAFRAPPRGDETVH